MADEKGVADIILLNLGDPVPGAVELCDHLSRNMKASLVVSYLGGGEEEQKGRVGIHELGLSVFPSPERAMRAIGASWRRAESVRARSGSHFKSPPPAAGPKTADALQTRFLTEPEALGLLAPFGLPYPRHKMAASSGEAVKAADELGYPVVLKLVSPDVPHKSEAGGVMTGLSSAQEVEQAHERIMQNASAHNPEAEIRGVLVCRQARPGLEAIVGAVQDPVFGPTLMFGLGGIHTELFKDVSFRVLPIDRSEAKRMIREIKGFPLLAGFRGAGRGGCGRPGRAFDDGVKGHGADARNKGAGPEPGAALPRWAESPGCPGAGNKILSRAVYGF